MKEQILSLLIAKVGISEEKAEQVVDTIFDYIRQHPHQLTAYLENGTSGSMVNRLGNFFN
jgi:hypothetical protein